MNCTKLTFTHYPDFYFQSNTQESICEPLYYIVMTTNKEDKVEYIKFTCNVHQLQDLCTKFREIVAHVEKVSLF